MPGKERSLARFCAVVETSDSGDRAVKGRRWDHLILPLWSLNVHIVDTARCVPSGLASTSAGGCTLEGCTGVYRGVYTPLTTAFTAFSDFSDFSEIPLKVNERLLGRSLPQALGFSAFPLFRFTFPFPVYVSCFRLRFYAFDVL